MQNLVRSFKNSFWGKKIHDIHTTKQAFKTVTINLDPLKTHLYGEFLYFIFIKLTFFKLLALNSEVMEENRMCGSEGSEMQPTF